MFGLQRLMSEGFTKVGHVALGYIVAQNARKIAVLSKPSLLQLQLEATLVYRMFRRMKQIQ